MYLCLIVALTLMAFLLIGFYKKNANKYNVGTYIVGLYIFSIVLTLFVDTQRIIFSLEASLYFVFCLSLFLIPILRFNLVEVKTISAKRINYFKGISYFFIFSGFCSYLYFVPIIYNLFTSGVSLLLLRTDMVGGKSYSEGGILFTFLNFTCQFYPIILIFYFYSITFMKNTKIFNGLLLFSSTAYILNVLSAVGRDGFILWLMSYIFAYLIFFKFQSSAIRSKQKKLFIYMLIICLSFIVPITIARFFSSESEHVGETNPLVAYSGEQFSNFNNFYNRVENPEEVGSINKLLPILNLFESNSGFKKSFLEEWEVKVFKYGVDPNVFSTFIGSFYQELGKYWTIIVCFIAFLIGNSISNRSNKADFSKILLITVFSQVVLHGYFYFKLNYTVSFLYILSVMFIASLFKKVPIKR